MRRSNLLVGAYAVCMILFVGILYDAQIVNGADYVSKSIIQVTTTQIMESSRGIITDRNGKVLVSNKEIYVVTFDPDQVRDEADLIPDEGHTVHQESVANALLRLLRLCREHGVTWSDGLPVSQEPPFAYTLTEATGTQRAWFQSYLTDRKWSSTDITAATKLPLMSESVQKEFGLATSSALSAEQLMELMRKDFGIPSSFTDRDARMVLGVLYETALRKLERNAATIPYVLAEDISVELISILNDGGFSGAVVSSRSIRQYHTDHAAHILGRVGAIGSKEERDGLNEPYNQAKEAGEDTSPYHFYQWDEQVGKSGVELAFESYLLGKEGTRLITTNQEGKITSELYSIEPQPGGTLALTIDIDFQAQVEAALARGVEQAKSEAKDEEEAARMERVGGAAVVVSVKDSEILASATYPTYSQRTYAEDMEELSQNLASPYTNRALNSAYAPGSTFKPMTAVAALESGIITPSTRIRDTGTWYYPEDPNSLARCWLYRSSRATHGRINVSEALTVSCNYFFAELGYQLGMDQLNEFAADFGLGEPTGIELGERTGARHENAPGEDQAPWAGFGQASQEYTPLQLANYIATLVRGGERLDAHLLKNITAYDGSSVLYEHQPEVLSEVSMSEETLAAVKKGMGDLVTRGSIASDFADCIVTAGAKTGSAQVGEQNANGVFVCFAPFDEPEIAVAVVIEQGRSGSALAATAVEILNDYFAPSDIGAITAPEGALLH
ncbi:MAG: penicillin-binding protein A [Oscillospiraceae bacterium]|nr:penicillin-binding protein A [Oscillospiraceae bacterium]